MARADVQDEPRQSEKPDRLLGLRRSQSGGRIGIDELFPGLPDHGREQGQNAFGRNALLVLSEIGLERDQDVVLLPPRFNEAARLDESADGRGKSADDEERPEPVQQPRVERRFEGSRRRRSAGALPQAFFAERPQELGERERTEEQIPYPPHAEIVQVREDELQKGSRGDDVQVGRLFVEVPQAGNRPRTRLDFVEEQQRPPGNDAPPREHLDAGQNGRNVERSGKQVRQRGIRVEVQFDE